MGKAGDYHVLDWSILIFSLTFKISQLYVENLYLVKYLLNLNKDQENY